MDRLCGLVGDSGGVVKIDNSIGFNGINNRTCDINLLGLDPRGSDMGNKVFLYYLNGMDLSNIYVTVLNNTCLLWRGRL